MILKKLFKFLEVQWFSTESGVHELFMYKTKATSYSKKEIPAYLACKKSLVCAVPKTKLYNLAQNLNHMNKYVYLLQNSIEVTNVNAKF